MIGQIQKVKNMATIENLEKALLDLVREDASSALSVLTGLFVSLTLEVLRRQGHVPDGEIRIDGGDQRDITIHKPKTHGCAAPVDTIVSPCCRSPTRHVHSAPYGLPGAHMSGSERHICTSCAKEFRAGLELGGEPK